MTDYLLRFPDEATAQIQLSDYYNDSWTLSGAGFCLDPIGTLYALDENDPETETALEGWHVNLRVWDDRPNPAPDYAVSPQNQLRVWL